MLNTEVTRHTPKRIREAILERYPGIEEDMKRLAVNPYVSLDEVALKHDVTREYIRLICPRILRKSYKEIFREKLHKKAADRNMACSKDPRGISEWNSNNGMDNMKSKAEVLDRCYALGYRVEVPRIGRHLLINGKTVKVRMATEAKSYSEKSHRRYYRFSDVNLESCDFVISHIPQLDEFYIFPVDSFAPYLPANESRYHFSNSLDDRVSKYREAWHLLKEE